THRRPGAALIAAMVVLAVLGVLIGTTTIHIARTRQALVNRANLLQARWLAYAGIEIAIDRLRDGDFEKATVEPIEDSRVAVSVTKDSAVPDRFVVRATVEYPTDGLTVMQTMLEKVVKRIDGRIELSK